MIKCTKGIETWHKTWTPSMSVRLNDLSLKYHRFATSSCKDLVTRNFELVAKTQFLWMKITHLYGLPKENLGKFLKNIYLVNSVSLIYMGRGCII